MAGELIWRPTDEVVERANVTRLARRMGAGSYPELLQRSVSRPERFWETVIADVGLEFARPYAQVLNVSAGPEWALWFLGGGINIAHNCVDRHRGSRHPAVVWEGENGEVRRLTYDELSLQVARFAAALQSLGVRKGDAVGLYLPMIPEAVIAFMGCAKMGAIAVPIFSGFAAMAVASRLNDSEAKVLVCADGFLRRGVPIAMKPIAEEAAGLAPSVRRVMVVSRLGVSGPLKPPRDVLWDEIVPLQPSRLDVEDTDAEDPFMIAYTSGTTGRPKGAVHVHGGFLVKVAAEVAYQTDYTPPETLFWLTDMGWIMGPWEVVGTLALGGTVLLYEGAPDHPNPGRLWSLVERHRVNILGVSPTLVRALMAHGTDPVASHDLSSLRILGSTGEPWNPGPYRWYFDHVGGGRCPVINFSGGTEVGACFLSPTPVMPMKACSLGGPALGMAVDVWDDRGRPVRGGVGELVCTKPWPGMTRGIWGDQDRYIDTYWSRWRGVWVHGDWASVDSDGEWFLHGRSDDTINVAGKRIGPAEVESALVGHPRVAEAAVIGMPDEVKGESIWCYVVLAGGAQGDEATRAELSAAVTEALGRAFRPGAVRFVAQLPKTRNAKVLRRAVRAVALGQDPGDLSNIENLSALDDVADAR